MAFRHGLISFLIIIVTSLILITVGIVLLVKFRNGFNAVRGLSILLILIGIIMMLFSKKMCIRNVRLKGNIVVTPLSEMHISHNVKSIKGILEDIESLKEFKVSTTNGVNNAGITEMLTGTDDKGSRLEVKILVFDSVESAFKSYNSRYKSYGKDYGIMEKGGAESDRYFITYVNQLRASPESLYELTDSYMTYLYFQKNNIVISLWEMRGQSESKIEQYINLLANRLSKLDG